MNKLLGSMGYFFASGRYFFNEVFGVLVYLAAVSAVSANPVPLPWESSRFPSAKGIFEWA